MTHLQLVTWLETNRPGAHWSLTNNTYDGFIWFDDPLTKPTALEMGL